MKPTTPWSIRTYILLLVALASLPLLCALLYGGRVQQREARLAGEQQASYEALSLAILQERAVAEARQFLGTLAEFPQVKRQDAKACTTLFSELLRQNPQYDNLLATTPAGDFYASGRYFFPHNARDRRYFQEAIHTRRFSSGEFAHARVSNQPVIHFALPVLGPSGEVLQVLVLGLDLAKLNGLAPQELPPGRSFALLDHTGNILRSGPQQAAYAGSPFPLWPLATDRQGLVRMKDSRGLPITYATRSLSLAGEATPYMTILVSLPEAEGLAAGRRTLWRNLLLLVLATLLTIAGALVAGTLGIIAPLRHLLTATRTFAEGQPHAPLDLGRAPAELGQLASAFQTLTETSAAREAQRLQAAAALRQSETRYRAMVVNAPLGIFHFNNQGIIQECNEGFAAIVGSSIDKIQGFNMLRTLGNEPVRMAILESLCGRRGVYEGPYAPVITPGRTVHVRVLTYGICNEDGRFLGGVGIVENISARYLADQALKESEARYQGLFKNSPDCIFWIRVEEDGRFLVESVNPAQEAAAGLTAAEWGSPCPTSSPRPMPRLWKPTIGSVFT